MTSMKDLITGIQHIGIPCADLEQTIRFYEGLGFCVTWRTDHVAFLKKEDCVVETYLADVLAGKAGAIDHIALNVTDIEAAFEWVKATPGYESVDAEIQALPFFEKGVRFFSIHGPSGETVEFNQIL
jgi:lactoylglutathione lyase